MLRISHALALLVTAVLALALLPAASFAQVGPPGGMIYANDELFRTVGTPTSLPDRGRFDTIYALGGDLANVSDAAPGSPGYNGGRWEVRPITWVTIDPTQFTNAEQVLDAAASGAIEIGDVINRFECPLIRVKGNE
jgi:hypothetical protein